MDKNDFLEVSMMLLLHLITKLENDKYIEGYLHQVGVNPEDVPSVMLTIRNMANGYV